MKYSNEMELRVQVADGAEESACAMNALIRSCK